MIDGHKIRRVGLKFMNPNLIGFIAVLSWGATLSIASVVEDQIGVFTYLGVIYGIAGLISFRKNYRIIFNNKTIFFNRYFYIRWIFFFIHEFLLILSVGMVSKKNLPLVILVNYLWPTAIIICSIFINGVKITRIIPFIIGTTIVVLSLSYEILGSKITSIADSQITSDLLPLILVAIGAVSWGLYCAFSRRNGEESGKGEVVCLYQISVGCSIFLTLIPAFHHEMNLNLFGGSLLFLNVLLNILGYYCWNIGITKGNIVVVSLLADFIPWISLFLASTIAGAQLSLRTIITAIFLVIGALATRFGTLDKKTKLYNYN